jgi:Cof subfamily protein (haloacid dehalogenase superfamily)
MPVTLIAVDLDGTLLDSDGTLSDPNRDALEKAAARGLQIAVATGRSFHHTKDLAARMPDGTVLILNNGALVKDRTGTTLAHHGLPADTARYLVETTREVREGAAAIFDRSDAHQFVCERVDWTHPHRQRYYLLHRESITETGSLGDAIAELGLDPLQIGFTGGVRAMRELAASLDSLPRAGEFSHTLTEYPERDFSLLDVLGPGRSKGRTLAELAASRGIEADDVMAVGDNLNDRTMLEFAGVAVVMGNASPELKALGWPETATNDAGGIAQAIERFVLGEAGRPAP